MSNRVAPRGGSGELRLRAAANVRAVLCMHDGRDTLFFFLFSFSRLRRPLLQRFQRTVCPLKKAIFFFFEKKKEERVTTQTLFNPAVLPTHDETLGFVWMAPFGI